MRRIAMVLVIFLLFISCTDKKAGLQNVTARLVVKDTNMRGVEFVHVPAGSFRKGRDCCVDSVDYPFWMGKYEVTNKQFFDFLKSALDSGFLKVVDYNITYNYPGDSLVNSGEYHVKVFDNHISFDDGQILLDSNYLNHPVISTTWYGAKAFCNFYGFDLPNISEWEKAARGMNCHRFPWGNQIDSTYANYLNSNDPFEPNSTPVGFYNGKTHLGFSTSNAVSFYGCYDMVGNAWEWLSDYWDENTPYHFGKGGGFLYHSPAQMQIYYHSTYGPSTRPPLDMCDRPDGFRVVFREKDR